jgi:hypothetical protein
MPGLDAKEAPDHEGGAMHFPIRFEKLYGLLSTVLLIPPSSSWVDVSSGDVEVRMGWAFHAKFPLSAVKGSLEGGTAHLTRGVHGLAGRWLVNGAGDGLVTLSLNPAQRGRVLGIPVSLRELTVSVTEPGELRRALGR